MSYLHDMRAGRRVIRLPLRCGLAYGGGPRVWLWFFGRYWMTL